MTLNRQTFTTRAITAAVFAVIMLAGILWNKWSFFILFSVIHFGCWIEYRRLVIKIDPGYQEAGFFHEYGVMLAGWLLMIRLAPGAYTIGEVDPSQIPWWMILVFLFIAFGPDLTTKTGRQGKNIAHSLFGLIYISLSLALMLNLYGIPIGNPALYKDSPIYIVYFPLLIICCMWVNDTMAYIVGSLIGKTPFSKISPKKTWEGTIGGLILGAIVTGWLAYLFDDWFVFGQTLVFWLLLAFIAAVAGIVGDLFESKLKRMAEVKDSGTLMPGHGGFLDRFDSMLFAIPFTWLYVQLFLK